MTKNSNTVHEVPTYAFHLEKWYRQNKRELPWRDTDDPYLIWLSEVILQQTRVAQGLPYYEKFVAAFPTVRHLAFATEEEVLRLWQGLGYYSRARNMHACAKIVIQAHKGVFPSSYAELIRLKGIGKYTAAAISSFAANEHRAVVDGNVYRVLSRYLGIEKDISKSTAFDLFQATLLSMIPKGKSAVINQATMELGAVICKPKKPDCSHCPLNDLCYAQAYGKVGVLPVKSKKIQKQIIHLHYFLVIQDHKILLKKRPLGDIWAGLYDFPHVTYDSTMSAEKLSKDWFNGTSLRFMGKFKHELTHKRLLISVFANQSSIDNSMNFLSLNPESSFFSNNEIEALPKPVIVSKILELVKTADFSII